MKLLNSPESVSRLGHSFERANMGLNQTEKNFNELTAALNAEQTKEWEKAEKRAMEERGTALRIFDVNVNNGRHN